MLLSHATSHADCIADKWSSWNVRFHSQTTWLYCMECPQYSTRLEAPGYLYVSSNTVSPALRSNSVPGGMLIHPAKWLQ